MDTNALLSVLRDLMTHQPGLSPAPVQPVSNGNSVLIATMVIGAAINMLGLILTYMKSSSTETKTDKAADALKEIHVAVNSKSTITEKKIEDLTAVVLKLTEEKATSNEQLRAAAAAKVVAENVK